MRPDTIRAHLKKEPFQAIRIHVSDGSSYEVPHPEFMIVTRDEVIVVAEPSEDQVAERVVYLDPIHVTRVTRVNGSQSRHSSRPRRK